MTQESLNSDGERPTANNYFSPLISEPGGPSQPIPAVNRPDNFPNPLDNPSGSYKWIFAVLAVIILVLIFLPTKTAPDKKSDAAANPSANELAVLTSPSAAENQTSNFDYILPENWTFKQRAEWSIGRLAAGQKIESGIVTDPADKKIVYFAASLLSPDQKENLISLYAYNISDYTWHRLFRRSYRPGDLKQLPDDLPPAFHVMGFENGRLILFAQAYNESPPPCFEPLLPQTETAGQRARAPLSLEIARPYQEFEIFAPSQNLIEALKARQVQCQKSIP